MLNKEALENLPDRVKQLPKHGLIPIPFFAHIGEDGVPDFRILNAKNYVRGVRKKLCGICGQKLSQYFYFIGGLSTLGTRAFADLPMHFACAK